MRHVVRTAGTGAVVMVVLLLGLTLSVVDGARAQGTAGTAPVAAARNIGWVQVAAGDRHTCAIKITGRLYCWGSDAAGQLGDGGTNTDQSVPVEVAGGIRNWASVSAGGFHTCARTRSSQLYCWGSDFWGQLGNGGANADIGMPAAVAGTERWDSVSAGYQHTCAIARGGRLYCWGNDGSGRLGNDAVVADQTTPVEVAGAITDWRSVSARAFHSCAVERSGRLWCWGLDSAGQLGNDAALAEQHTPVEVAGGATDWTEVGAGQSHTCGLKRSGQLYCWGWDAHGELGDDADLADQATPVVVGGGVTRWRSLTAGSFNTCAVGGTGRAAWLNTRVYCWGLDEHGGLGDDAGLANQPLPVVVAGSDLTWAGVDAGEYHGCAISLFGRLRCWGLASNGQLGDGGTTDRPTPILVSG